MSEQNIYPFYILKLILEPPPTQYLEKKIILHDILHSSHVTILRAVRKIQRRLQNTVHCKLPQKMGYLQIIPSSAWDGEWWDFGRNLNQEKKFALENFRNELSSLYDKLSESCFKIILISQISFSCFWRDFFENHLRQSDLICIMQSDCHSRMGV